MLPEYSCPGSCHFRAELLQVQLLVVVRGKSRPVADTDQNAFFHGVANKGVEMRFHRFVQGAGCLIKEQDVGLQQQHARQGDTLLFAQT